MIKIIKGTYGYCDGKKVIPKTAEDKPFSLTPEQEARLVGLGVAEYVGTSARAQNIATDKQPAPYNVNMKLDELKAIAAIYEVDASKVTAKAKVIEMIDTAVAAKSAANQNESDEDGDDNGDEEPPVFDAVLPVTGE